MLGSSILHYNLAFWGGVLLGFLSSAQPTELFEKPGIFALTS